MSDRIKAPFSSCEVHFWTGNFVTTIQSLRLDLFCFSNWKKLLSSRKIERIAWRWREYVAPWDNLVGLKRNRTFAQLREMALCTPRSINSNTRYYVDINRNTKSEITKINSSPPAESKVTLLITFWQAFRDFGSILIVICPRANNTSWLTIPGISRIVRKKVYQNKCIKNWN